MWRFRIGSGIGPEYFTAILVSSEDMSSPFFLGDSLLNACIFFPLQL